MWSVTELIPYVGVPVPERKSVRLFFIIYYRVTDNAFKKSAETWLDIVKQRYFFDRQDMSIEKEVSSEGDFKGAVGVSC